MSENAKKLINLINSKIDLDLDCSLSDIVLELGLSRSDIYGIFRELSLYGIDFSRRYYDSGDIVYVPKKDIQTLNKGNSVNIITRPGTDSFRVLLISDLHAGSTCERRDLWDVMMNYCIVNNIHSIIIAGDFIDGINRGKAEFKIHNDYFEQILYAVNNYPSDESIINYLTLGNHDIDSLISNGMNFATYLRNYRHDIVPVGYGYSKINIKNEKMFVTHPLCIGVSNDLDLTSTFLLIKGHHHNTRSIIGNNGNCSLNVPSLSNLFLSDNEFLPGAIDMSIKFKNGFYDCIYYEHLLFNNSKIYSVSTTQYSFSQPKDRKNIDKINNEGVVKRKVLRKNEI